MSTYSHHVAQTDPQSYTHDREVAWLRRNQRLGEIFLVSYVAAWILIVLAVTVLALFGAPEPAPEPGASHATAHRIQ